MNVKFKGITTKLLGKELNVGDNVPSVRLKGNDLGSVTIGGKRDKIQIINAVPSLDTPVCAIQAKTFNKKAGSLPNIEVFVVSMDLPFAAGRFCSNEGIVNVKTLSDALYRDFGEKFGVLIGEGALEGLLARAVFIVDTNGKLIYKEVCEEITNEPNYEAVFQVVK